MCPNLVQSDQVAVATKGLAAQGGLKPWHRFKKQARSTISHHHSMLFLSLKTITVKHRCSLPKFKVRKGGNKETCFGTWDLEI